MTRPDIKVQYLRTKAATGTCRLFAPQVLELLSIIDQLCGALEIAAAANPDPATRAAALDLAAKYKGAQS